MEAPTTPTTPTVALTNTITETEPQSARQHQHQHQQHQSVGQQVTPPRTHQESASQHDMDLSNMKASISSTSPPGSYTRIPPRSIDPSVMPPILPPHLLQVILNNPDKINTTILPQPNHVMLNHLYALSIKEGIMVLSATHRFRKKYVTTILYKPIMNEVQQQQPSASPRGVK